MIKQCLVCDKDFLTYPCKIKVGKGKYCSKECCLSVTNLVFSENGKATRFYKGQEAHNKKGFQLTTPRTGGKSYKLIHKPEHINANKDGCVREHRLVMEEHLGRILKADEVVHHKDGDTLNNKINNLSLMSVIEHCRLHTKDNVHKRWQLTPAS